MRTFEIKTLKPPPPITHFTGSRQEVTSPVMSPARTLNLTVLFVHCIELSPPVLSGDLADKLPAIPTRLHRGNDRDTKGLSSLRLLSSQTMSAAVIASSGSSPATGVSNLY